MSDEEGRDETGSPTTRLDDPGSVLLLSGGGFRATLFHLGVARYLCERGRLSKVRKVFSISGGSIFAGFLAANWGEFSDPDHFPRAAREVIKYAQSDARGRLLRRFLAGWAAVGACLAGLATLFLTGYFAASMTWWLAGMLVLTAAILFWVNPRRVAYFARDLSANVKKISQDESRQRPLTLKDLPSSPDRPQFHFITTDLTSGHPWVFTRRGVWRGDTPAEPVLHETYPLGNALAASAAFPPLFPPLLLPKKIDREKLRHNHFLADGGVHDNLGIEVARRFSKNNEAENQYIISNAERRFDKHEEGSLWLLPRRAARATDILMNRASTLHSQLIVCQQVRLADEIVRDEVTDRYPASVQRVVRNVRTDLNQFSNEECQLLYFSGYLAAWETLDECDPPLDQFRFSSSGMPMLPLNKKRWLPFEEDLVEDPLEALASSDSTPLGLRSRTDRAGFTLLCLSALFFIAMTPPFWGMVKVAASLLPSSPSLPDGAWLAKPEEASDDGIRNALSSIWDSLNARREEEHGAAMFVSTPLSQSYGWPPSGAFELLIDPKEGNRLVGATRAYLLHADGSRRELQRTVHEDGFWIEVPGDQPDAKLCLAVLLGAESANDPSDSANPLPGDETIWLRIFQPQEKK